MKSNWFLAGLFFAGSVAAATVADAAVVFGQLDDFENGDVMGWSEGAPSPNPPTVVADGGPGGDGDGFLSNVARGGFGAGSRQVMFNQSRWAGNYVEAGVTRISGWAANLGSEPLYLRVAFDANFNRFASTEAFELPADGVWRRVAFDLTPEAMTRIQGTQSLDAALAAVTELRILSAAGGPAYLGEAIASTLALDDLRAMRPEGDADFDGAVDAADLRAVRSNLGTRSGATWAQGDFNFDGRVNAVDVALLRRNMRHATAATSLVLPEPTTALALAATFLFLRRPRRAPHAR